MDCKAVVFSEHASHRMLTRGIGVDDVLAVIRTGEIIELYPSDTPYPSVLLLGSVPDGALHVLVATDQRSDTCVVVTVYRPDQDRWNSGLRTRRRP